MSFVTSISAGASVTIPTSTKWWLKDPLNPAANISLTIAPGTLDLTSSDRQNIVRLLNRPDPVVLCDVVELPSIKLPIIFLTDVAYQKYKTLRQLQRTLLLQGPYPVGHWYVRLGDNEDDKLNLPSLRQRSSNGTIIRTVDLTCQAVAAP